MALVSIAGNQPKRFHYRQRLPDVFADIDLSNYDQPIDFTLENPALGLEIKFPSNQHFSALFGFFFFWSF